MMLPALNLEGVTNTDELLARVKRHADECLAIATPIYAQHESERAQRARELEQRKNTPGYCMHCGARANGARARWCQACRGDVARDRRRRAYQARPLTEVKRPSWRSALATLDRLGCSQNMCEVVAQLWGLDAWEHVAIAVADYRQSLKP